MRGSGQSTGWRLHVSPTVQCRTHTRLAEVLQTGKLRLGCRSQPQRGATSAPPPPGETMVAPDSSSALPSCLRALPCRCPQPSWPRSPFPPCPRLWEAWPFVSRTDETTGRLGAGRPACTLGRPGVLGRGSPTPCGAGGTPTRVCDLARLLLFLGTLSPAMGASLLEVPGP